MIRTHPFYRLKSTAPLRHLSLALLLLCGFTSWIVSDFDRADATASSVYLVESNEFIAANNSEMLRVRTGIRKIDLSGNNNDSDLDSEQDPIWLLLSADLTELIIPSSSANHYSPQAYSPRSTCKYLLKTPRAPPFA
jgi:hypothetical protein